MASKIASCNNVRGASKVAVAPRRAVVARASSERAGEREQVAAQQVGRRAMVGLFAGVAAVAANQAQPSLAAYGEAANVFGSKSGNFSGFTAFQGDGYSLQLPAKWNPSKEILFEGTDLR